MLFHDAVDSSAETTEPVRDFEAFLEKLKKTADTVRAHRLKRVPLPNLIFSADPGMGVTHSLLTLLDSVKTLRLMTFVGEEECFEWTMTDGEGGLDALLERVEMAGGFYGQFRGIVGLDVSALLGEGRDEARMERLMEFVDARQGDILFVFIVPANTSQIAIRRLLRNFASRTPAELIRIPRPDADSGCRFLLEKLSQSGLRVSRSGANELRRAIETLRQTAGFVGYQTLENLRDEILWRKASGSRGANVVIDPEDVAFMFEPDGFIKRVGAAGARADARIGFSQGEE